MADNTPQAAKPEASASPASGEFHIGEEMDDLGQREDRAQTTKVVVAVLVAILIVLGILSYLMRAKPKTTGSVDGAYAVALQGDNVLATIKVTINNVGGKPLWIKNLRAQLTTADGKQFKDDAANAADFDRYFQGYPDLRERSLQPVKVETKLGPGEKTRGSVIVSFPVTLDTFKRRQSLQVIVEPYDRPPVTLGK
jgi:hypothetical protein